MKKKLAYLAAAAALVAMSGAFAQDMRQDRRDVNKDERDMRRDRRDINKDKADLRQDRRELHQDVKNGDTAAAQTERADMAKDKGDLKADRRDVHADKKDLRKDVAQRKHERPEHPEHHHNR